MGGLEWAKGAILVEPRQESGMKQSAKESGITSWYDGFVYSTLFAPIAGWLRDSIAGLIEDGSSVLDVACGPGLLAFRLSGKCAQVTGIDFSRRMIDYALAQKKRHGIANVAFVHGDATRLRESVSGLFDWATVVMCLHEIQPEARRAMLAGSLETARRVILVDYLAPFPGNPLGAAQTFLEACAGKRHFAAFRDWQERGGMEGFLESEGLKVQQRLPWKDGIGETVIVTL
jgi:SAM-dependent methyltransferase